MGIEFSAFDFHSHTIHSKDGLNHPNKLFKYLKKAGLRGIALTEHWRASILKPIIKEDLFLLPACEFKCTDYGELIGLFVTDHIENKSFVEIAEDVHDQNGLTILPHPMDPLRKHTAIRKKLPKELIVKHVDLIEGINSRCIINLFNSRAQKLAKDLRKPMTAGSDAHTPWEIGHARTWLQDIETVNDIYEELKAGRTQISGYCSFFLLHIPSSIWERIRKLSYDAW
jgi:predicted metal-dependent phosphoesterase TrpH